MYQYPYTIMDQGSIGREFSFNEILGVPEILVSEDCCVIIEAGKFSFFVQET